MSAKLKKQYLIQQLNSLGIYKAADRADLQSVDYRTLRGMLAVQKAVRS